MDQGGMGIDEKRDERRKKAPMGQEEQDGRWEWNQKHRKGCKELEGWRRGGLMIGDREERERVRKGR